MKQRASLKPVVVVLLIIVGLYALGARHRSPASPTSSVKPVNAATGPDIAILSMSQKSAGLGDGSFYHYVTIENQGDSLASFVGIKGWCTNDAGTVVGTAFGDAANVAPGEQTVVTVIFLSVNDCKTIHEQVDSVLK